jgi:glycerol uptake facilitator protein
MTPFMAELIGTAILITLGGGVVANVYLQGTKGNGSGWIVVTTAWALAVFVGVVVAGPYSGGHLNPAVTLAVFLSNNIDALNAIQYVIAQFLGAMIGAMIVWIAYIDHFKSTTDPGIKQAVFCTAPAIKNTPINLFSEVIGTFILLFAVFYLKEGELSGEVSTPIGLGSIGAIPVAFVVWVIGLALGGTTGYAINPARDLGPRIVHALLPIQNKAPFNSNYAWIPVVGPLIGAVLAVLLVQLLGI